MTVETPEHVEARVRRRDGTCVARIVDAGVDRCGDIEGRHHADPPLVVAEVRTEWGDSPSPEQQRVLLCAWHAGAVLDGSTWRQRHMEDLRRYLRTMYAREHAGMAR